MKQILNKVKCFLNIHDWKVPDGLGYLQHGKRVCVNCSKKQSALLSSKGIEWLTTYKGD